SHAGGGEIGGQQGNADGVQQSHKAHLQKYQQQAQYTGGDTHCHAPEGQGEHLEGGVKGPQVGHTPEKLPEVFEGNLNTSLAPANPLAVGLLPGGGLLVKQDGVVAVANPVAPGGADGAELDVLRQCEELPASHP